MRRGRVPLSAARRGKPVVTVAVSHPHSPMQRSGAQSRSPNAVLAYAGSVVSPRNSRYGYGSSRALEGAEPPPSCAAFIAASPWHASQGAARRSRRRGGRTPSTTCSERQASRLELMSPFLTAAASHAVRIGQSPTRRPCAAERSQARPRSSGYPSWCNRLCRGCRRRSCRIARTSSDRSPARRAG